MPLLYEQICDYIIDEIAGARLRPGDRIPTEQELASTFAVSRITIRRAMSRLQRDGLIERFRGKGTFVTDRAPHLAAAARPDAANAAPRSAPPRPRRRIGFIIPEVSDLFGVRMLNGIDDRCQEYDIDLSIRRSHGSIEIEARTITAWIEASLDGIIVFPSHGEFYNPTLLRAVLNGFPIVLVDRTLSGIPVPSVLTDHYEASRTITRWLLAQGHQSIAFVSPTVTGTSSLEERQRGFHEALLETRQSAPPTGAQLILDSVLPGRSSTENFERDRQRIRAFLEEHTDITGVLASEFGVALLVDGVLSQEPALRGRSIQIACFDSLDAPMSPRTFPHIRQDEQGIGRLAVDLVLEHLAGKQPTGRHHVPFALVTAPDLK